MSDARSRRTGGAPSSATDEGSHDVMRSSRWSVGASSSVRAFDPPVDVRFDDDQLRFVLDVPGVRLDDLSIEVVRAVLTVTGARHYDPGAGGEQILVGRPYGAFRKAFKLPDWVDPETLTANLSDGVLAITVQRHTSTRRRRVPILEGARSPLALSAPRTPDDDDE